MTSRRVRGPAAHRAADRAAACKTLSVYGMPSIAPYRQAAHRADGAAARWGHRALPPLHTRGAPRHHTRNIRTRITPPVRPIRPPRAAWHPAHAESFACRGSVRDTVRGRAAHPARCHDRAAITRAGGTRITHTIFARASPAVAHRRPRWLTAAVRGLGSRAPPCAPSPKISLCFYPSRSNALCVPLCSKFPHRRPRAARGRIPGSRPARASSHVSRGAVPSNAP